MTDKVSKFLKEYNFIQPDVKALTKCIYQDMENGLAKKSLLVATADQPMLVASRKIPVTLEKNSSTIVIDAGGTNFRSCLVTVDENGRASISEMEKTTMPGIERELSKQEFYDAIAVNLDHLKNKATRIGFCFSYAMEITPEGDGKVLVFSKEIKAPEAIGTYVGAELKKALLRRGWNEIEKITLLNDTTASLLAGVAEASGAHQNYSSYVGFILGTGINNAYIEYNPIEKLFDIGDRSQEHIVVCECGMFGKVAQSDFDKEFDENSTNPGASKLEKMCSGAYLGSDSYNELKHACEDGLFSSEFCTEFAKIEKLMPVDMDEFLMNPDNRETKLGKCIATSEDKECLSEIILSVLERAARIVAAILSASVLKCGRGTDPELPVCIVANGSTFWKAFGLYDSICKLLQENLSGEWQRFYKIVKIDNDIVLGTAVGASL